MISPGFHSAAFPVHLSGLWVAIGRACRHFSFYVCQFFSSACLALLCMHSIQSSDCSSWLDVLSVSSSEEILLPWSYSSFVLAPSCVSSLISSFGCLFHLTILYFSFCICFCLNDETKPSALGSAELFSCSFVSVHVRAPYVIVGVTTASKKCKAGVVAGKIWMSVLVWRMRTKRIGSCVAPRWFPGPRIYLLI